MVCTDSIMQPNIYIYIIFVQKKQNNNNNRHKEFCIPFGVYRNSKANGFLLYTS